MNNKKYSKNSKSRSTVIIGGELTDDEKINYIKMTIKKGGIVEATP